MTVPTFSIIIPAYNRAWCLWKTVLSIQSQMFTDWELIIVDDGSTDDTKKMVAEFQGDRRVHYVFQENGGPSAARNKGLEQATGDIIVYCDSDDMLYPQYLGTVYQTLADHPDKTFGVCNHNRTIELLDENYKVVASKPDPETQNNVVTLEDFYNWRIKTSGTGLFHRRAKFKGKAEWRGDFRIQDLEFLMQLAMLDREGFIHIPQTLIHYRHHYGGDSRCSQATYADYAHAFGTIYELHKDDPLMTDPSVYLDRVEKYKALHEKVGSGEVLPPVYKYFPEFWES